MSQLQANAGRRETALASAAETLDSLVERGGLSRHHYELVLRAATHAVDPQYALGFAVVVTHYDPDAVPLGEAVDLLIRHRMPFSLLWPPARWQAKHKQLAGLKSLRRPKPVRYTTRTGWLDRCLPADARRRRICKLDSSDRLFREALRQRTCFKRLARRLKRGRLAGLSILADGRRWTVTLRAPVGWRRPTVHRIRGPCAAKPDDKQRAAIVDILGDRVDATPGPARVWRTARRSAVVVGGLFALLGVASIEPVAPRIPEVLVGAVGVSLFALRECLSYSRLSVQRLSAYVFTMVWWGPPAIATVAIHFPAPVTLADSFRAMGVGAQLFLLPASYLAAALAWPPLSRLWHTRRRGRTHPSQARTRSSAADGSLHEHAAT